MTDRAKRLVSLRANPWLLHMELAEHDLDVVKAPAGGQVTVVDGAGRVQFRGDWSAVAAWWLGDPQRVGNA